MKKYLRSLAVLSAVFFWGVQLHAQNFTIATGCVSGVYKVSGSSLVALSVGSIINPGDIIVMPWVASTGGIGSASGTGALIVTANPSGSSLTSFAWERAGDIDAVTGTLSSTSSTSTNSFNTINEHGTPDLGQSKGRVTFSWIDASTTCGEQYMSFDVIKSFNNGETGAVPSIVGPQCLLPNTEYTFSVAPIVSQNLADQIGLDRYFWYVSAGLGANGFYYSTDSSSITFTTGSTITSPDTIICGFGVANNAPWQTTAADQASSILLLSQAAGVPSVTASGAYSGTVTTGTPACIPTTATVTGTNYLTLSVTPVTGATYVWGFGTYGLTSNGWNTSPPASGSLPYSYTGSSITIADVANQPGTITLTVTDACGNMTDYTYTFNRSLVTASQSLISLSSTCTLPGTAVTATLSPTADLSNVTWTPITGWLFGTSNPYSVTPTSGVAPGAYTVTATLGCGSGIGYTVNVSPPTPTISLTNNCSTSGSTVTLTAAGPSSGTSYSWAMSGGTGYSFVSGINTGNPVSATLGTSGTADVTVTETVGTCTVTATSALNIGLPAVGTPSISCTVLDEPSTLTATVSAVTGATGYQWSVSPTTYGTTTTNTTSPTATFSANGTTGTFTYSVTATNGTCNTTASASITLSSSPAPFTLGAATFTPACCGNPAYYSITTSGGPFGKDFYWYDCDNNTLLTTSSGVNPDNPTSAGSSTWYFVNTDGSTINFGAQITANGGCVYRLCEPITGYENVVRTGTNGGSDGDGQNNQNQPNFKVSPNPNPGMFRIDMNNSPFTGSMSIFDATGQKLFDRSLHHGANDMSFDLPDGVYLIKMSVGAYEQDEKIVISK